MLFKKGFPWYNEITFNFMFIVEEASVFIECSMFNIGYRVEQYGTPAI